MSGAKFSEKKLKKVLTGFFTGANYEITNNTKHRFRRY